jgi:hypothetical protein
MSELPKIIGLCGRKRVGKGTMAEILSARFGYGQISFAQPMRWMLDGVHSCIPHLFDVDVWSDEFKEETHPVFLGRTGRHILETLGTEWGRNQIGDNLWTHIAMLRAEEAIADGYRIVISDVRFPNEIEAIHKANGLVYYISRPGHDEGEATHVSDEAHKSRELCDYEIINDSSLEDFKEGVFAHFAEVFKDHS